VRDLEAASELEERHQQLKTGGAARTFTPTLAAQSVAAVHVA
jgi:hypothetical protein